MDLTPQTIKRTASDPAARTLVDFIQRSKQQLGLEDATVYYRFPIYKEEEAVVASDVLVLSRNHGVIALGVSNATKANATKQLEQTDERLDQIFNHLFSRLVRYKRLRSSRKELAFNLEAAIYAPFVQGNIEELSEDLTARVIDSERTLATFFSELREPDPIDEELFQELSSVIEGSKALPRPKERDLENRAINSKVAQVAQLEAEIARFDMDQKSGFLGVLNGFQRIRGLAGSGKTVVLAMKAALTHLAQPDARIAYTFHTKSLYQHVQRLITRFYRQFDDKDPNWEKLTILHSWGGRANPGIYSTACAAHGVKPLTFDEAQILSSKPVFEFVCDDLLSKVQVQPIYDYVFVDEGQDFPLSFLRLAIALAKEQRLVLAYDELQTIFQTQAPSISDIFGVDADGNPKVELEEDVVLHKCYRNPLEVLVCAHALGFGIYGKKIVQMLENRDHWFDLGYEVENETLLPGEPTRILRPRENSPSSISATNPVEEIIVTNVFNSVADEVKSVTKAIHRDIRDDGLEPDDILVVCVDDRNARRYLGEIARGLVGLKIGVNNMHDDSYGIRDFAEKGCVTLATVHKAKGNEAYMVYVIGIDALYGYPAVRARNMIFTAMTRAKAWLRISGMGVVASAFAAELNRAKEKLPYLEFVYPTEADIKMMKRDLQETSEQKMDRALEELEADLPSDELAKLLEQKLRVLKGQKKRGLRKAK